MSCPTCGHTMSNLGLDQAHRRTFWCPRCGTIKTEFDVTVTDDFGGSVRRVNEEHGTPFLVTSCRRFAPSLKALSPYTGAETAWHRLGIPEAINLPADR
jgi:hypothetical protein